jgi:hypothetical protein
MNSEKKKRWLTPIRIYLLGVISGLLIAYFVWDVWAGL